MKEEGGGPGDDHGGRVDAGDEVHAEKREANAFEDGRCFPNGCRPCQTRVLAETNLKKDERKSHKYVAKQPGYEEST